MPHFEGQERFKGELFHTSAIRAGCGFASTVSF
jgi:cation diffusion facilitator CzcD-associated flavoprotein CzcO